MIGDVAWDISSSVRGVKAHMVEKDMVLHALLSDLLSGGPFAGGLLFKGGTCLIKHHLGYFRFSEDLDFTWRDQGAFAGLTRSQFEKRLGPLLDGMGAALEGIAARRGLDFRWDKGSPAYADLANRGKISTFKVYYVSQVLGERAMVKVQVNFSDVLCFDPVRGELRSFGNDPRARLGGSAGGAELSEYMSPVAANLYDIREILSEKVRAVLTRRGVAPRDFVDMHAICGRTGLRPEDVEPCAIRKTEFAVRTFRRYRDNFLGKRDALGDPGVLWSEGDEDLFAGGAGLPGLKRFVDGLAEYLPGLAGRIDAG